MSKIHQTVGVYANGERVVNGVCAENLKDHVEYNKTMRFGRALFVDGKCVHQGYLDKAECDAVEASLVGKTEMTRDTAPYK